MQFHAPWSTGAKGGVDTPHLKLSYVHLELSKLQKPFEFKPIVQPQTPQKAPTKNDAPNAAEKKDSKPAAAEKKDSKVVVAEKKDSKPVAEKKDAKKASPAQATQAVTLEQVPTIVDLRVGKVVKVEKHPKADRMYVEEIDFGEEKPRVVCSGLVGKIEMSALKDRVLVAVCNLKPVNLKGIDSQAMVLVAQSDQQQVFELPRVPEGAKIGERLQFDGHSGAPAQELKKEHLEQLFPVCFGNCFSHIFFFSIST